MGDRIEVPLALTYFEVTGSELVEGVLEVGVVSTFRAVCGHCGAANVTGHGRCQRRIRDQSHGYPTVLVWDQRRYKCRDCGRTSRERHPETLGAKRVTRRFRLRLAEAACDEPLSQVAARERVSWWRVADAFDQIAEMMTGPVGPAPRVVSLDEASFKRGFGYHTVLSAPEQRRILDLVPGRSLRSAHQLLTGLPSGWDETIETAVIDMFWPFRRAIEQTLPGVRIVVDKFHVIRAVSHASTRVRIRNSRRREISTGRQGSGFYRRNPRFDPFARRHRWLFLKRHDRLTGPERDRLTEWFSDSPETGVAWLLKETFGEIYAARDRDEATARYDQWAFHVAQAGISELSGVVRTLEAWKPLILNYFDDPQTNGYAEGITNKIKVLKRRGYGYRHPDRYRAKILAQNRHRPTKPPPIA